MANPDDSRPETGQPKTAPRLLDRVDQVVAQVPRGGFADPVTMATDPDGGAPPWVAPRPSHLPDLRLTMRDFLGTAAGVGLLAYQVNASDRNRAFAVLPVLTLDSSTNRSSNPLPMAALETRRLDEAQLYWVDHDATSLSLAASASPAHEPVKARRLPAEAGLMVFAQPIGSFVDNLGDHVIRLKSLLANTTISPLGSRSVLSCPIVAVSWSSWTPRDTREIDQSDCVWVVRTPNGYKAVRPGFEGIWLTFYTTSDSGWGTLPIAAHVSDFGMPTTAGSPAHLGTRGRQPQLLYDSELLLELDKPLPPPQPNTPEQWAHVVYTAWQLMGQTGNAQLTETESVARQRKGRKRDQRAKITGSGTVQLVRVHTRHRPSALASAEDAAASDGRQAPEWACRWPVRPYRRNTCLNTRAHAAGGCEHEEQIVPGHIRGPADKPLKISTKVHVWDTPPPAS